MAVFPLILLVIGLTFAIADPLRQERIIGGFETTIQAHPFSAVVLLSPDFVNFRHECGGTIINNRSVMTTAYCILGHVPMRLRIRVGSVSANVGGVISNINAVFIHPNFNQITLDSDIGILRSVTTFAYSNVVQPASIAGNNYILGDNVSVTGIGWGVISYRGPRSETLRQVQIWTVNQDLCRTRYAGLERNVTENMLCAGWIDVGGRGQCAGDEGSPLIHNNVVVGFRSWGQGCGLARYPGVNTRISRFTAWISANA